jgi:hypothetical protein
MALTQGAEREAPAARSDTAPAVPSDWSVDRTVQWGPFLTSVRWRRPDGSAVSWSARRARKRAAIELEGRGQGSSAVGARRQHLMNLVASMAFFVGGSLFAAGAAVAQFGSGEAITSASIYFAGGLFFNTGGYVSLLQAINAPRGVDVSGFPEYGPWRWWSWEPDRIDWLSAFVLLAGTVAFGINLLDSFLQGLTVQQVNRLIWAPDMVGCILFLISGHLALVEAGHPNRFRPRADLGWWVAALNQIGSVLFFVSGVAAFIRPETSMVVNEEIANWGTLLGALCFAIGGVVQAFERPSGSPA